MPLNPFEQRFADRIGGWVDPRYRKENKQRQELQDLEYERQKSFMKYQATLPPEKREEAFKHYQEMTAFDERQKSRKEISAAHGGQEPESVTYGINEGATKASTEHTQAETKRATELLEPEKALMQSRGKLEGAQAEGLSYQTQGHRDLDKYGQTPEGQAYLKKMGLPSFSAASSMTPVMQINRAAESDKLHAAGQYTQGLELGAMQQGGMPIEMRSKMNELQQGMTGVNFSELPSSGGGSMGDMRTHLDAALKKALEGRQNGGAPSMADENLFSPTAPQSGPEQGGFPIHQSVTPLQMPQEPQPVQAAPSTEAPPQAKSGGFSSLLGKVADMNAQGNQRPRSQWLPQSNTFSPQPNLLGAPSGWEPMHKQVSSEDLQQALEMIKQLQGGGAQ